MGSKKLLVVLASFFILVAAAGLGLEVTREPSFCGSCHEIKPSVISYRASSHNIPGVACLDCHADSGEVDIIMRKFSGIKAIGEHFSGAPDPIDMRGYVPNRRCLKCHSGKTKRERTGQDINQLTGALGKLHKRSTPACSACHVQSAHFVKAGAYKLKISKSDNCAGCHTRLAHNEKSAITKDFGSTVHGILGCIMCHGGKNAPGMKDAHVGMVKDPSSERGGVCTLCHAKTARGASDSLHYTLNGVRASLGQFAGKNFADIAKDETHGLTKTFNGNCYQCHATCGQCHVSRPGNQNGGLLNKHMFEKKPPMDATCNGCHGTRNAGGYTGKDGGNSDIHYAKKSMHCSDCHGESSFHGDGNPEGVGLREMKTLPSCRDCHKDRFSKKSKNKMHAAHEKDLLACQVCHAMPSTSCTGCHIATSRGGGLPGKSRAYQSFKIGLNPDRTSLHPEKYVVVQHTPAMSDSFKELGKSLLPNYDKVPNWKVSAPHTIQIHTPQNTACDNCHGNQKLFLTEKDLQKTDSKANERILVRKIPERIGKRK